MNLKTLQQQFDRVTLKHIMKDEIPRTIAILSEGDNRFVGISYCHSNDQFDRRKGRQIALGRALHRFQITQGDKQSRNPKNYESEAAMAATSLVFNINNIPGEVISSIPEHLYLPRTKEEA